MESTTRLEQLNAINQYKDLFLESIEKRRVLIEAMRAENSPYLSVAEKIQERERDDWTTRRGTRKTLPCKHLVMGKEVYCSEVASFSKVPHGELCYVPSADHYALRIGPVLFHGNVGKLVDSKNPEKIKNCKNKNCKRTYCNYYHDPIEYGGTECRNFIKNYYNDPIARNDDDTQGRCSDRIMHDILTLIAAHQTTL